MKMNEEMKHLATYKDIKIPTTIEEFRQNLEKFYLTESPGVLIVSGEHSLPIKDLSSFDDIYTLTGTGFGGDGTSPAIVPLIDFDMNQIGDTIEEMRNPDFGKFDIYTNQLEFGSHSKNQNWYSLDNGILRNFYAITLGEYSGYLTPLSGDHGTGSIRLGDLTGLDLDRATELLRTDVYH